LNKVTLIDPFPNLFTDEIINKIALLEFYSIKDGFLGYNQVSIAKEHQEKRIVLGNF
jgi:hypothetical protein